MPRDIAVMAPSDGEFAMALRQMEQLHDQIEEMRKEMGRLSDVLRSELDRRFTPVENDMRDRKAIASMVRWLCGFLGLSTVAGWAALLGYAGKLVGH